ncbi:MAG: hypothetical protein WDW38_006203 [Sanguina aurantia]
MPQQHPDGQLITGITPPFGAPLSARFSTRAGHSSPSNIPTYISLHPAPATQNKALSNILDSTQTDPTTPSPADREGHNLPIEHQQHDYLYDAQGSPISLTHGTAAPSDLASSLPAANLGESFAFAGSDTPARDQQETVHTDQAVNRQAAFRTPAPAPAPPSPHLTAASPSPWGVMATPEIQRLGATFEHRSQLQPQQPAARPVQAPDTLQQQQLREPNHVQEQQAKPHSPLLRQARQVQAPSGADLGLLSSPARRALLKVGLAADSSSSSSSTLAQDGRLDDANAGWRPAGHLDQELVLKYRRAKKLLQAQLWDSESLKQALHLESRRSAVLDAQVALLREGAAGHTETATLLASTQVSMFPGRVSDVSLGVGARFGGVAARDAPRRGKHALNTVSWVTLHPQAEKILAVLQLQESRSTGEAMQTQILVLQAQAKSSGEQQQRFLQELSDERQSRHRSEQQARLRDEQGRSGPEAAATSQLGLDQLRQELAQALAAASAALADNVSMSAQHEQESQALQTQLASAGLERSRLVDDSRALSTALSMLRGQNAEHVEAAQRAGVDAQLQHEAQVQQLQEQGARLQEERSSLQRGRGVTAHLHARQESGTAQRQPQGDAAPLSPTRSTPTHLSAQQQQQQQQRLSDTLAQHKADIVTDLIARLDTAEAQMAGVLEQRGHTSNQHGAATGSSSELDQARARLDTADALVTDLQAQLVSAGAAHHLATGLLHARLDAGDAHAAEQQIQRTAAAATHTSAAALLQAQLDAANALVTHQQDQHVLAAAEHTSATALSQARLDALDVELSAVQGQQRDAQEQNFAQVSGLRAGLRSAEERLSEVLQQRKLSEAAIVSLCAQNQSQLDIATVELQAMQQQQVHALALGTAATREVQGKLAGALHEVEALRRQAATRLSDGESSAAESRRRHAADAAGHAAERRKLLEALTHGGAEKAELLSELGACRAEHMTALQHMTNALSDSHAAQEETQEALDLSSAQHATDVSKLNELLAERHSAIVDLQLRLDQGVSQHAAAQQQLGAALAASDSALLGLRASLDATGAQQAAGLSELGESLAVSQQEVRGSCAKLLVLQQELIDREEVIAAAGAADDAQRQLILGLEERLAESAVTVASLELQLALLMAEPQGNAPHPPNHSTDPNNTEAVLADLAPPLKQDPAEHTPDTTLPSPTHTPDTTLPSPTHTPPTASATSPQRPPSPQQASPPEPHHSGTPPNSPRASSTPSPPPPVPASGPPATHAQHPPGGASPVPAAADAQQPEQLTSYQRFDRLAGLAVLEQQRLASSSPFTQTDPTRVRDSDAEHSVRPSHAGAAQPACPAPADNSGGSEAEAPDRTGDGASSSSSSSSSSRSRSGHGSEAADAGLSGAVERGAAAALDAGGQPGSDSEVMSGSAEGQQEELLLLMGRLLQQAQSAGGRATSGASVLPAGQDAMRRCHTNTHNPLLALRNAVNLALLLQQQQGDAPTPRTPPANRLHGQRGLDEDTPYSWGAAGGSEPGYGSSSTGRPGVSPTAAPAFTPLPGTLSTRPQDADGVTSAPAHHSATRDGPSHGPAAAAPAHQPTSEVPVPPDSAPPSTHHQPPPTSLAQLPPYKSSWNQDHSGSSGSGSGSGSEDAHSDGSFAFSSPEPQQSSSQAAAASPPQPCSPVAGLRPPVRLVYDSSSDEEAGNPANSSSSHVLVSANTSPSHNHQRRASIQSLAAVWEGEEAEASGGHDIIPAVSLQLLMSQAHDRPARSGRDAAAQEVLWDAHGQGAQRRCAISPRHESVQPHVAGVSEWAQPELSVPGVSTASTHSAAWTGPELLQSSPANPPTLSSQSSSEARESHASSSPAFPQSATHQRGISAARSSRGTAGVGRGSRANVSDQHACHGILRPDSPSRSPPAAAHMVPQRASDVPAHTGAVMRGVALLSLEGLLHTQPVLASGLSTVTWSALSISAGRDAGPAGAPSNTAFPRSDLPGLDPRQATKALPPPHELPQQQQQQQQQHGRMHSVSVSAGVGSPQNVQLHQSTAEGPEPGSEDVPSDGVAGLVADIGRQCLRLAQVEGLLGRLQQLEGSTRVQALPGPHAGPSQQRQQRQQRQQQLQQQPRNPPPKVDPSTNHAVAPPRSTGLAWSIPPSAPHYVQGSARGGLAGADRRWWEFVHSVEGLDVLSQMGASAAGVLGHVTALQAKLASDRQRGPAYTAHPQTSPTLSSTPAAHAPLTNVSPPSPSRLPHTRTTSTDTGPRPNRPSLTERQRLDQSHESQLHTFHAQLCGIQASVSEALTMMHRLREEAAPTAPQSGGIQTAADQNRGRGMSRSSDDLNSPSSAAVGRNLAAVGEGVGRPRSISPAHWREWLTAPASSRPASAPRRPHAAAAAATAAPANVNPATAAAAPSAGAAASDAATATAAATDASIHPAHHSSTHTVADAGPRLNVTQRPLSVGPPVMTAPTGPAVFTAEQQALLRRLASPARPPLHAAGLTHQPADLSSLSHNDRLSHPAGAHTSVVLKPSVIQAAQHNHHNKLLPASGVMGDGGPVRVQQRGMVRGRKGKADSSVQAASEQLRARAADLLERACEQTSMQSALDATCKALRLEGGAEELQDLLACTILSEVVYKKMEMNEAELADKMSEYVALLPPGWLQLESVQVSLNGIPQHYIIAAGGNSLYVAFMGTKQPRDLITDANVVHEPVWAESVALAADKQSIPAAHRGFLSRARAIQVEQLYELAQSTGRRLVLCGHSLGGAVAKLCTLRMLRELPSWPAPTLGCVCFATPAVGNSALAELVESAGWASHFKTYYLPEDQLMQLLTRTAIRSPPTAAASETAVVSALEHSGEQPGSGAAAVAGSGAELTAAEEVLVSSVEGAMEEILERHMAGEAGSSPANFRLVAELASSKTSERAQAAQAASSSSASRTAAGTSRPPTDLPATPPAHTARASSPNPGLMLAMQRKRAVRALRSLAASAHLPWPSPPVSRFHSFGQQWFVTPHGIMSPEEHAAHAQEKRQLQPSPAPENTPATSLTAYGIKGPFGHHRMLAYRLRCLELVRRQLPPDMQPAEPPPSVSTMITTSSSSSSSSSSSCSGSASTPSSPPLPPLQRPHSAAVTAPRVALAQDLHPRIAISRAVARLPLQLPTPHRPVSELHPCGSSFDGSSVLGSSYVGSGSSGSTFQGSGSTFHGSATFAPSLGGSESVSSGWAGSGPMGLSPTGSVLHMHYREATKGVEALEEVEEGHAAPPAIATTDRAAVAAACSGAAHRSLRLSPPVQPQGSHQEMSSFDGSSSTAPASSPHTPGSSGAAVSATQPLEHHHQSNGLASANATHPVTPTSSPAVAPGASARPDKGRHPYAASASPHLPLRRSRSSSGLLSTPRLDSKTHGSHQQFHTPQLYPHTSHGVPHHGAAASSMAGSPVVGWGEDPNITLVVQVQGSHLQYTRHVSARIAGGPELQTTVLRIFYAQPGAEGGGGQGAGGPQGQLHPLSLLQSGLQQVAVGLGRFFTRRGEEPPLPLTHSSPLHPTSSPETMTPISHSDDHSSSSSSRTSPLIDTLTTTAPWDSIPMPNSTPAATSTAIPSRTGSSSSAQGTSHMLVEVTLPRAHLAAARAAPDSSLYLHLRSDFHETVAAVSLAPHRAAIIGTSPYAASLVHAALMATLPEEREEEEESAEPATVPWWWPQPVKWANSINPWGAGSATPPPQPHPAEATRPLIAAVPPQTSQSAQAITPLPNHAATLTHSIATPPPSAFHSAQQAVASHAAVSDGRLSTVVPSVAQPPLSAAQSAIPQSTPAQPHARTFSSALSNVRPMRGLLAVAVTLGQMPGSLMQGRQAPSQQQQQQQTPKPASPVPENDAPDSSPSTSIPISFRRPIVLTSCVAEAQEPRPMRRSSSSGGRRGSSLNLLDHHGTDNTSNSHARQPHDGTNGSAPTRQSVQGSSSGVGRSSSAGGRNFRPMPALRLQLVRLQRWVPLQQVPWGSLLDAIANPSDFEALVQTHSTPRRRSPSASSNFPDCVAPHITPEQPCSVGDVQHLGLSSVPEAPVGTSSSEGAVAATTLQTKAGVPQQHQESVLASHTQARYDRDQAALPHSSALHPSTGVHDPVTMVQPSSLSDVDEATDPAPSLDDPATRTPASPAITHALPFFAALDTSILLESAAQHAQRGSVDPRQLATSPAAAAAAAAAAARAATVAHSPFGRTLDAVEQDMPAMTVRANAWASGDLDALRKLPDSDRRGTCVSAITDADFARKLGLSDVPARMEANWLVLARASLAKNAQTFALLPIKELLSPTGYLSRLKAEGYRVAAPDDDSYDDDPAASGTAAQPATAVPGVATH